MLKCNRGSIDRSLMEDKVILVVDDTNISRAGTVITVQKLLGFEVDEADDGTTALAKVKTNNYAAILMDCDMPTMNGLQCTALIRELEKDTGTRTPIIAFTASTEIQIREKCLKAGMDDYLEKSCSNAELSEMLVKWTPPAPATK